VKTCVFTQTQQFWRDNVIGHRNIIGGNAWVTKSIPAKSMVLNTTTTEVKLKDRQYRTSKYFYPKKSNKATRH
jgi:serine O-acetyltransferase